MLWQVHKRLDRCEDLRHVRGRAGHNRRPRSCRTGTDLLLGNNDSNRTGSAPAAVPDDARRLHGGWLAVVLLFGACRLITYLPPGINDFATTHYLFSYAAGFHKRALIGSLLALCFDRLSGSEVYAVSLATLLVLAGSLVLLLRRALLCCGAMLVVGVVLLGAPGALPHFAYSIGYFDAVLVLWALLALSVLDSTIPDWMKVPLALVACALGVLTHEAFLLTAFPVACGWSLIARTSRPAVIGSLALAVFLLTVVMQVVGHPSIGLEQYIQQASTRTDMRINTEAFELLYFRLGANLSYLLRHYSSITTDIRLLAGLIVLIPYYILLRDLYCRAADATAIPADARIAGRICILAPIVLALAGFDVLRWLSFVGLNCSILICAYVRRDTSGAVVGALSRYVRSTRFMLLALLSYSIGAIHVVDSNSLGSGVHAMARGLGLIQW